MVWNLIRSLPGWENCARVNTYETGLLPVNMASHVRASLGVALDAYGPVLSRASRSRSPSRG